MLTLRGYEALRSVRKIFVPVAGQGRESFALSAIQEVISAETTLTELTFPMSTDRSVMDSAYRKNYLRISAVIRAGDDAALITIGDPATYSTAWQIVKLMQRHMPEAAFEIIPGITSYSAAASRAGIQLAQGSESMAVVSSYADVGKIEKILDCSDTVVFLKTFRSRDLIIDLLRRRGFLGNCVYVRRCGLPDEEIVRDLTMLDDEPDYFSMIILRKAGLDQ